MAISSNGLGYKVFILAIWVRIPLSSPHQSVIFLSFFIEMVKACIKEQAALLAIGIPCHHFLRIKFSSESY